MGMPRIEIPANTELSVTFLESCSLVASDLMLQKRFYNVLSDLCLEISNIQKHVW